MAGVGGFEPPTFRFVAECSIQLSYTPLRLSLHGCQGSRHVRGGVLWESDGAASSLVLDLVISGCRMSGIASVVPFCDVALGCEKMLCIKALAAVGLCKSEYQVFLMGVHTV